MDDPDVRRIPDPILLVGVAVVYAALAQFVLHLNDPVNLGAGLWPARASRSPCW